MSASRSAVRYISACQYSPFFVASQRHVLVTYLTIIPYWHAIQRQAGGSPYWTALGSRLVIPVLARILVAPGLAGPYWHALLRRIRSQSRLGWVSGARILAPGQAGPYWHDVLRRN